MAKKTTKKTKGSNIQVETIDDALLLLQKKFGKTSIRLLGDSSAADNVDVISTGSILVDGALGVGGLPRGRIVEIYGPEATGKAQPLDAKILSPLGWKTMGDTHPGDLLIAKDGTITTVIAEFLQGEKEIFEVTFSDGRKTECCTDHLWTVRTWDDKQNNIWRTLPLKELQKDYRLKDRYKYMIPVIDPIQFEKKELDVDPYILGVLLGDGSFCQGSTIKFSTADSEIVQEMKAFANKNALKIKKISKYDYSISKMRKGHAKSCITNSLCKLKLFGLKSSEKFIPKEYLNSNISNREALLQGLLDSDGYISEQQHAIEYVTTSEQLAKDMTDLAYGLGGLVHTMTRNTHYTKNGDRVSGKLAYRLSILLPESITPFRLTRKKNRTCKQRIYDHRNRWIQEIKYIGIKPAKCILIAHPDQLYITDNYIVTHNTTVALHAIAAANKAGGNAAFIDAEHSLDMDLAKKVGVNPDLLLVSQPDYGEQALELASEIIKTNKFVVVVIDSVSALTPKAEIDGEIGDSITFDTPVYVRNSIDNYIDILIPGELYRGGIVNDRFKIRWYKKFKSVEILTHTGWELLLGVVKKLNTNKKPITCVRTSTGYIQVTEDHSLFVNAQEKSPKELEKFDRLDIYSNIECKNDKKIYNTDIAWLLGFFVAEGSTPRTHMCNRFEVCNTDPDLIYKCKQIIDDNFTCETKIKIQKVSNSGNDESRRKDLYVLICSSNILLGNLMRECVFRKTRLKKLPKEILNAKKEIKQAFLDGFWIGDGSCKGKTKSSRFYHNNSLAVIAGTQYLNTCLGIRTNTVVHTQRPEQLTLSENLGRITKKENEIVQFYQLPPPEFLFDFSTESGTFVTAIGNIICHNSHMGLQARLMGQALRKLTGIIHSSNTLVIFINQLRQKIGVVFGNPETTSGGNALKFYSSVRLDIRKVSAIKVKGSIIGNRVKVKVVKNKLAPPYKSIETDLIFGKGFVKEREVIALGIERDIIERNGAQYAYREAILGTGFAAAVKTLQEDPEIMSKILAEINAKDSDPVEQDDDEEV